MTNPALKLSSLRSNFTEVNALLLRTLRSMTQVPLFCVTFFVGCHSSCGTESKAVSAPTAKKLTKEFPAISVNGLDASQLEKFTKIANEEVCPCDCKESFAECLRANTKCRTAQVLGQWIVDQIKEGASLDYIRTPLIYEILQGGRGAPQLIDLNGYLSKGTDNAKVTIVEYADFDCVHCKTTSKLMHEFFERHGANVKFVFKYFPLENTPASKLAACAVEAAGMQGKAWEMHDAAFETTSILSRDILMQHAKTLKLDMAEFERDLESAEVIKKVERSKNEGIRIGIQGTPALFFNGRPFNMLGFGMSGLEMRLALENVRDVSSCN